MLVVGTHHSEDEPPNVPYFREGTPAQKKTDQGTSIAETVAAAVAASMTALGSRNQQLQPSTSYDVEKRGQLINQLKDLKQLLADDVLTEDEYRQQKEKILREMDT
ncbi:uncharacterized protein [Montipora foliosa]|uniref:uncharacterized protein n=1 Tax=Montipora foliosa TaxID=591990 RepID=UPI0035F13BB0